MIDCRGGYRFVVGRVLFKNHSIFFWGGGGGGLFDKSYLCAQDFLLKTRG